MDLEGQQWWHAAEWPLGSVAVGMMEILKSWRHEHRRAHVCRQWRFMRHTSRLRAKGVACEVRIYINNICGLFDADRKVRCALHELFNLLSLIKNTVRNIMDVQEKLLERRLMLMLIINKKMYCVRYDYA